LDNHVATFYKVLSGGREADLGALGQSDASESSESKEGLHFVDGKINKKVELD